MTTVLAAPLWLAGGVTAVPGFRASGVHAGIKYRKPDVALIAADHRCAAAATMTRNAVQAAPLRVTAQHLRNGHAQAVVCVSGVANTCTGPQGERDAEAMAAIAGRALGIPAEDVIVASTGVIGELLPMDRVEPGILHAAAALSDQGGPAAARAVMTTDTRPKLAACRVTLDDGRTLTLGGIAKGAGMIHPNMATMLAFLTTDAPVEPTDLRAALAEAVDASFNTISVDGDTSPNDMVAILASGAAGGPSLTPGTPAFEHFAAALGALCLDLALQIVRDGEGAQRLFAVEVTGARSDAEALRAARAVTASSLVKTAVYGRDANWGRVLVAAGASGAAMDPDRASLTLRADGRELPLLVTGRPVPVDEALASALLGVDGVCFALDLGLGGPGRARAWGCDLTEQYVQINAAYRT